MRAVKTIKNQC